MARDTVVAGEEGVVKGPDAADTTEETKVQRGTNRLVGALSVALVGATGAALYFAKQYKDATAKNGEWEAKYGDLEAKNEGLADLAASLVAQVAELVTQNEWLKSRTGAGKTLRSYGGQADSDA